MKRETVGNLSRERELELVAPAIEFLEYLTWLPCSSLLVQPKQRKQMQLERPTNPMPCLVCSVQTREVLEQRSTAGLHAEFHFCATHLELVTLAIALALGEFIRDERARKG
jgi:hypothetical protein